MNREDWDCFCKTSQYENLSTLDSVKCINCLKISHAKCYEVYNYEAKQNFYCFKCRTILNDPFRDVLDVKFPPTIYHMGEAIKADLFFEIPPDLFSKVKDNQYSIFASFTRLIYEDTKYIDFPDAENKLVPLINGQTLEHYKRCSIILDKYIEKGKNCLRLVTNKLKFKCIAAIYVGKIYDVKEVAKKIATIHSENTETPEESKKNFEVTRFRDMEVLATFNIRDPLTNEIMSIPIRGTKCRHLQCFDFITYLKFHAKQTEKPWTCPCCRNIIPWHLLRIDNYMFKILQSIREKYTKDFLEDVNSITFDENGNWKFPEEFAKEWESNVVDPNIKKEKKKKDKNEMDTEESKPEPKPQIKTELTLEENINSFNLLCDQYKNLPEGNKIHELIAKKMKELNSFKNYSPYKFYDFLARLMLLGGMTIPAINYENDQNYCYKTLEEIADHIYSKKMSTTIPLIFSWAKSYDDLIVLLLLMITKKKSTSPDISLAIELFFCLSWFMFTKKISFEGLVKQSIYEILGKIIHYYGEKLNYGANEFAVIMLIFRKYFMQLYMPSQIPKKFGQETEKLFQDRADLISNMVKSLDQKEFMKFIDLIYKPPQDMISKDDEKHLKYFYYFLGLILKKYDTSATNDSVLACFRSWDKYSKAIQIDSFRDYSKITSYL